MSALLDIRDLSVTFRSEDGTVEEVPIGHITNGVHVGSWMAEPMSDLLIRRLGRNWREQLIAEVDGIARADKRVRTALIHQRISPEAVRHLCPPRFAHQLDVIDVS